MNGVSCVVIEYRFLSDKRISPFIHGGAGAIQEEDRGGTWALTAAAGIDINVTPRSVIPITFQFGWHRSSKLKGPYATTGGIGYRF